MKFKIGDQRKFSVTISDKIIRDFAELSGDKNPIHLDDAFAATTRFEKRIAHGILTGAFISRVLATDLPGPGAIYLGQTLRFTAPVFVDEEIEIQVTVKEINEAKKILTIDTTARKSSGEIVVKGEATVLVP